MWDVALCTCGPVWSSSSLPVCELRGKANAEATHQSEVERARSEDHAAVLATEPIVRLSFARFSFDDAVRRFTLFVLFH